MPSSYPAMNPTSFELKRGLAEFGYPDHYAVLGLEIDAPPEEVRRQYMRLARLLHPDSCSADMDKTLASQFLSKLINPAYQVLSQEKERTDYGLLLKLVGQRATVEFDGARFSIKPAQDVIRADDYREVYQAELQNLVAQQYRQLDQSLACIEQLSELNLAFLLRRESTKAAPMAQPAPQANNSIPISSSVSAASATQDPAPSATFPGSSGSYVDQYLRRAETYVTKNLFPDAIRELKDALKIDPQNSRVYCLMGTIYLRQNQLKMAKVQLTQALKFDPKNVEATEGLNRLKRLEAQTAKSTQPMAKTTQTGAGTPERRGLFGLFGGKK